MFVDASIHVRVLADAPGTVKDIDQIPDFRILKDWPSDALLLSQVNKFVSIGEAGVPVDQLIVLPTRPLYPLTTSAVERGIRGQVFMLIEAVLTPVADISTAYAGFDNLTPTPADVTLNAKTFPVLGAVDVVPTADVFVKKSKEFAFVLPAS